MIEFSKLKHSQSTEKLKRCGFNSAFDYRLNISTGNFYSVFYFYITSIQFIYNQMVNQILNEIDNSLSLTGYFQRCTAWSSNCGYSPVNFMS